MDATSKAHCTSHMPPKNLPQASAPSSTHSTSTPPQRVVTFAEVVWDSLHIDKEVQAALTIWVNERALKTLPTLIARDVARLRSNPHYYVSSEGGFWKTAKGKSVRKCMPPVLSKLRIPPIFLVSLPWQEWRHLPSSAVKKTWEAHLGTVQDYLNLSLLQPGATDLVRNAGKHWVIRTDYAYDPKLHTKEDFLEKMADIADRLGMRTRKRGARRPTDGFLDTEPEEMARRISTYCISEYIKGNRTRPKDRKNGEVLRIKELACDPSLAPYLAPNGETSNQATYSNLNRNKRWVESLAAYLAGRSSMPPGHFGG